MNTVEDLMFLMGYEKKSKNVASKWVRDIETRADNDWADGKNADKNPYNINDRRHNIWYNRWMLNQKNN